MPLDETAHRYGKFDLHLVHWRGLSYATKSHTRLEKEFYDDILNLTQSYPKYLQNVETSIKTTYVPKIYIRHQYTKNMSPKILNQVNNSMSNIPYIQFVRNPVDRFISDYYFGRYGSEITENLRELQRVKGITKDMVNETIAECFANERPDCHPFMNQILVKFFCGADAPECLKIIERNYNFKKIKLMKPNVRLKLQQIYRTDHERALATAKNNLLEKFAYVGVYQYLDESILLLEKTFPNLFYGVNQVYLDKFKRKSTAVSTKNINDAGQASKIESEGVMDQRTQHKKTESPETYALLNKYLYYDLDLYQLCVKLFYEKLNKFGIQISDAN